MTGGSGPYGSRSWTYDKVGNRLSEAKTVGGTTTNQTYSYPGTSNKLASVTQSGSTVRSFTYDAAGNTTGDTRSGTAYAYTINDAGRISQLTIGGTVKATYKYDAKNRLSVRQTLNMTPAGTTHLIHDKDDHVIVETNGAGTAVREYVWVGDLPVAVLDGSSTPSNPTLPWVDADHLKRPELMTDATKAVKWKAIYEPFGAVSPSSASAPSRSWTLAGWTVAASRRPSVSVRTWRLRPTTFLPAS